jgi:hypothetical protein
MELRAYDYFDDDQHDGCGNLTMAVVTHNGIKVHLCESCLTELLRSVDEFGKTVFCYKCAHWRKNKHGYSYDGTCTKKAERDGIVVKESDIGYLYGTGYMGTCDDATLKDDDFK